MTLRDHLRDACWLTRERVRGYAALLGLGSLALAAAAWMQATGPTGGDFLAFWGAGQVTAAGDPALAYDLAVQQQVQTATGSEGWFAFVNPPPFLFVAAPLGLLPYPLAWIAWVVLTWALWAWVSIRAFPRLWVLVLVYPGALIAATHAQTGLLTGALLVFAASEIMRRPGLSGAAVGTLIVKPHLALLAPFWLAAGGKWRAFFAAGLAAVALLALAWFAFGTPTMLGYSESWRASAALMEEDNHDFFLRMATAYAQARLALPDAAALGLAVVLALAMAVLIIASWRRFAGDAAARTRASAALMLAATALAVPYLFNYDLPFLIFPTLWLVEQGLRRGFRPYEKLLLVALYFAPYATRALAFPLGINLMPVAGLLLLWLIWTRAGEPPSGLGNYTPRTEG